MASNVCELAGVRHLLVSQSEEKLCECVSFHAVVLRMVSRRTMGWSEEFAGTYTPTRRLWIVWDAFVS